MRNFDFNDNPFPLKRYFIIYGGSFAVVFYVILIYFTYDLIRTSLWQQHIHLAQQRADFIFNDILRDILEPEGLSLGSIPTDEQNFRNKIREKFEEFSDAIPHLSKLKLFNSSSIVLYDHGNPENQGKLYADKEDDSFQDALNGKTSFETTVDSHGEHLMEIYVPVKDKNTMNIDGIIEIYEETKGFESFLRSSLIKMLGIPSMIFLGFVLVIYSIIKRANGLIETQNLLLRRIHRTMAKYLPDAAVNIIADTGGREEHIGEGKKIKMTVLFTDIRGFTAFSERSEPEVIVKRLNNLFDIQADVIYSHGGSIDKFVGDEIVALFEHSQSAVSAAEEIVEKLKQNSENEFRIGAGIHSGSLILGTLGTRERRDFSVIGDTVNTASRLCSKAEADEILITSAVFEQLTEVVKKHFDSRRTLELKGKQNRMDAFSYTIKSS